MRVADVINCLLSNGHQRPTGGESKAVENDALEGAIDFKRLVPPGNSLIEVPDKKCAPSIVRQDAIQTVKEIQVSAPDAKTTTDILHVIADNDSVHSYLAQSRGGGGCKVPAFEYQGVAALVHFAP
jgi:hypothetical protein